MMPAIVGEVFAGIITWLPWAGFLTALFSLALGIYALGEDDAGRDLILLSIAVTLLTGLFVGLVMVQ